MSDSPVSMGEQPAEGDDAFGSLSMPRAEPDGAEPLVGRAGKATPVEPAATKEERLKKLIPVEYRESFAHSATWWQNNIEIFKHRATGRYLYLSKEAEDETNVHAYRYFASGHRFVEVPMEEAIVFATAGMKVGEKKRY